jgi:hypothetical protein
MALQKFRDYRGRAPRVVGGYRVIDLDGVPICRIEYYHLTQSDLCSVCFEEPELSGGNIVARTLTRYGVDPRTVLMSPMQTYERRYGKAV